MVDADADGCVLGRGQERLLSGRVAVEVWEDEGLDGLEPVWVVVLSEETCEVVSRVVSRVDVGGRERRT